MKRALTRQEVMEIEGEIRPIPQTEQPLYLAPSGAVYVRLFSRWGERFIRKKSLIKKRLVYKVYPEIVNPRRNVRTVYTCKLTENQVREIRSKYPQNSLRDLASEYGVSHETINLIVKRKTWKDIP